MPRDNRRLCLGVSSSFLTEGQQTVADRMPRARTVACREQGSAVGIARYHFASLLGRLTAVAALSSFGRAASQSCRGSCGQRDWRPAPGRILPCPGRPGHAVAGRPVRLGHRHHHCRRLRRLHHQLAHHRPARPGHQPASRLRATRPDQLRHRRPSHPVAQDTGAPVARCCVDQQRHAQRRRQSGRACAEPSDRRSLHGVWPKTGPGPLLRGDFAHGRYPHGLNVAPSGRLAACRRGGGWGGRRGRGGRRWRRPVPGRGRPACAGCW